MARYPGHDVTSGIHLGQPLRITQEPAEALCLRACLEDVVGCGSAVLVTNAAGTIRTCYFKGNGVENRVAGFPERFVLLGCESDVPPPGVTQTACHGGT